MDDAPVLTRIAAGDAEAVQQCLDRYGRLVWSLARRLCGNEADLEDAVQEIFVEIWKNAGRFDPARARESTFVAMIARRRLIDRLRRLKRNPVTPLEEQEVESPTDLSHQVEVTDEAGRALQHLKRLPEEQSEVILMAVYHGMSHSRIAEATGMPLGTVKSNMRRGLTRLRASLVEADTRSVAPEMSLGRGSSTAS